MQMMAAVEVLAALAQESRLATFRLLVKAGPEGMPAGEIAEKLGVLAATLSFHLRELGHAGLVTSRQQGRFVIYSANFDAMGELLTFLTQDCCDGHPELCARVAQVPLSAIPRRRHAR
jgi:DNA-binding transcriptional ArsR family regulator